jgi:hypothetical protein
MATIDDKNGMRTIAQYIQTIVNKIGAYMCCASNEVKNIFSYKIPNEVPIRITRDLVRDLKVYKEQNNTHLSMFV